MATKEDGPSPGQANSARQSGCRWLAANVVVVVVVVVAAAVVAVTLLLGFGVIVVV